MLKSAAVVVEPFAARFIYADFPAATIQYNATLRIPMFNASGTAANL